MSNSSVLIAPSILSANFGELFNEIEKVIKAGADWIHLDVMDGHFVPNLTFGAPIIKQIRKKFPEIILDVHLMIDNVDVSVDQYIDAGSDYITFHVEHKGHLHRLAQYIRSKKVKAGISLNPATPIESIKWLIHDIDLVLLMSVNPGFGGQQFIPHMLDKISDLKKLLLTSPNPIELAVDGGVSACNARAIRDAGASVLIAGNAIFSQENYQVAIERLRN